MTHKLGAGAVGICLAVVALVGCGGGGGGSSSGTHTYVVSPAPNNPNAKNFYVTIVSPVPIPTKLLTGAGGKIVSKAQGPEKCSYTKTVQGSHGPGAFLSGKTVTIKVTGTNPFIPQACAALKHAPLKASNLGG